MLEYKEKGTETHFLKFAISHFCIFNNNSNGRCQFEQMYDYRLDFSIESLSTLEKTNRADRPLKGDAFFAILLTQSNNSEQTVLSNQHVET